LQKKRFNGANLNSYRGYFPVQEEAVTSYKEGIDLGPIRFDDQKDFSHPFFEPNLWPSDSNWKRFAVEYFDSLFQLGSHLMSLLALGLGMSSDYFDDKFSQTISTLRFLHYPLRETQIDSKLSCSEHCDSGILTLLYQDDVGGLQVRNSDMEWIDVPYIPGSFVVNLGDMLQRWTNDQFVATMHRVLGGNKERYSVPYFFEPNFDALIECIPTCQSQDNPPKFQPTTYGKYLSDKILQFAEFQPKENTQ